MAVKEKDLTTASSMAGTDYVRMVTSSGDSKKIEFDDVTPLQVDYTTTVPTADNTKGLKFVLCSSEPGTKYNGWIYLIEEQ